MTNIRNQAATTAAVEDRFTSLAALRSAHNALVKRYRDAGDTLPLLDEIELFVGRGARTGALLDEESERWNAQSLLDYWSAALYRAGRQPSSTVLDEFDPELAPELPDELCPYLGLEAFTESRRQVFFGRNRLVEELVGRLRDNRLLAVIGPSGSGKSSLVLAGLLPVLKGGAIPGSDTWHYRRTIVPGSDPLRALARALAPAGSDAEAWVREQAAQLLDDTSHLAALLGAETSPTVLVIDQFEELFTVTRDERTRRAFALNLLRVVTAPGVRHTVILTMRSDFESQVATLPEFQEPFERAQFRVTPLSAAELREAIEKPAELVGLRFEEGLVDRLVKETLGEPAGLPLLQFTLLKLWQNRERNRVTLEMYDRLGGGRQALARSADEFYANLIPEDQVTAKRILLRMVQPGEGLEVTSSRIRRELLHGSEPRERVDRVLNKLIAARLVRQTDGDRPEDAQVEVAHEALVRNWPTLVRWLDEERATLRQRLRLTAAAEQWAAHRRDPGGLLGGSLLDEARRYTDLNVLEREFVEASIREVERIERIKEETRRRELEQAQALAQEQRRRAELEADRARQLRRAFSTLLVFFSVTLLIAVVAWRQMRKAEENRVAAEAATAVAEKARADAESKSRELEASLKSEAALRQQREILNRSFDEWRREVSTSGSNALQQKYSEVAPLSTLVEIKASAEPLPGSDRNYTFTLSVAGSDDALNRIASVQYEFNHPTFREKTQSSTRRAGGFAASYVGWGCLSSVIVTLQPVARNETAEKVDFDMCRALGWTTAK